MKKLFLFACMVATMNFVTQAQNKIQPKALTTTAYGSLIDTVDNTEAHYSTPFSMDTWRTGVTAQVKVTKISGTVGGAIGLWGCMTNSSTATEWTLIGSAATPTDTSASYGFNTTVAWRYYQLRYTGTGTMSAAVKFFIMPY